MSETLHVPYEYLAEHLAQEAVERALEMHDIRDPSEVIELLPGILHAAIYEGIEVGLRLTDFHKGDLAGPSELLTAYKLGFEHGKTEESR